MTAFSEFAAAPWPSIIYGLSTMVLVSYETWRASPFVRKILIALGGINLAIGCFNFFVEDRGRFMGVRLTPASVLLIIIFLVPYRTLCFQLMEITITNSQLARRFSFLPFLYTLLFGVVLAIGPVRDLENPALALYVFVVVCVALHVTGFAVGKSEAIKRLTSAGSLDQAKSGRSESSEVLRPAIMIVFVPALLVFVLQLTTRDDWRLAGTDGVMAGILTGLILIARSQQPLFEA